MPFAVKVILVLLSVLLLEIYFVKRVVHSTFILFPRASKKKIRIVKWIVLTLVNIYPLVAILAWIYVYINRTAYFAPPENFFFDYFVLYPFWIGTMIIVQATLFFLMFEILNIILMILMDKSKRKKLTATLFFILFAITVIYVPIRIVYDYHGVEIREVMFTKAGLPNSLNGFKIAFISDVQADRYTNEERLSNYIEKLNSTNPDLVLIAGDVITSTPDFINVSAEYLGMIKSKYGTYSCVGDHDNWAYRGDNERSLSEITNALNKVNIPMIDNDKLILGVDSANIEVTFVTNTYVERANNLMLNSLTQNDNHPDLRIFLTHQPRQFLIDKALEKGYDLYLCGHTHGGQITFLFPFYNLSPTLAETTFMRGDFPMDNMLMVVTRGLGMSLAPVRFNSTPEITIITLSK